MQATENTATRVDSAADVLSGKLKDILEKVLKKYWKKLKDFFGKNWKNYLTSNNHIIAEKYYYLINSSFLESLRIDLSIAHNFMKIFQK